MAWMADCVASLLRIWCNLTQVYLGFYSSHGILTRQFPWYICRKTDTWFLMISLVTQFSVLVCIARLHKIPVLRLMYFVLCFSDHLIMLIINLLLCLIQHFASRMISYCYSSNMISYIGVAKCYIKDTLS